MGKFIDMTGWIMKEHGVPKSRLTVLKCTGKYVAPNGWKEYTWLCECDCGEHNKMELRGSQIRNGSIKSCGCLQRENAIDVGHKNKSYNTWLDNVFVDEHGEYRIGLTSNTKKEFYVDVDDYDIVCEYCWMEHITDGYSRLEAKDAEIKKMISLTQLLGCQRYDHIDRNPLNNRRYNLRPCTIAENSRNRTKHSNNTSGVMGVCWSKNDHIWLARIGVNQQKIHIGSFANKEDAIVARLQAEAKYFGKFAPQRHLFEEYGIGVDKE